MMDEESIGLLIDILAELNKPYTLRHDAMLRTNIKELEKSLRRRIEEPKAMRSEQHGGEDA